MPRKKPQVDRFGPFKAWLAQNGAEVLEPTSEWEAVRFRGNGLTSIVYVRRSGAVTFTGDSRKAWNAFEAREPMRFAERAPRLNRERQSPIVQTLLKRDGARCFFCAEPFTDALPPTKEHLVPKTAGGPDHLANMFLACEPCNQKTGHRSAAEKIRFRDLKRRGAGTVLLIDLRPHVERLSVEREANGPNFLKLLDRLDSIIHRKETADA